MHPIRWSSFIKHPPAYLPLFSSSRTLPSPIPYLDGTEEVMAWRRERKEVEIYWNQKKKKKERERERMKQCKVGHTFVIKSKPNLSVCVRWNYLILLAWESLWSTSQVCDWISAQQNLKLHTYCAWAKPSFTAVEKASPGLLGSVRSSAVLIHWLMNE